MFGLVANLSWLLLLCEVDSVKKSKVRLMLVCDPRVYLVPFHPHSYLHVFE